MAVQLFLNGQEVVTDSSQEIRVTKENPYFTLSDSYTLDVSIPLNILQNCRFFGCLDRIDKTKQYQEYNCRLLCANALVMEGTAHIVQSTDQLVKVQLASGVSALKMSVEQEGMYIDRLVLEQEGRGQAVARQYLDYGATLGSSHTGYGFPLLDSTSGTVVNLGTADVLIGRGFPFVSECPRLLDIARLIAARMGFQLDLSCLPEACGCIYVVSATQGSIGKKLPHWTVKEFFTQFQNFFGCTFIRSGDKQLKLMPLASYASNSVVTIEPVSEFQVEYAEGDETDGVMNSNLEFQMEGCDREIVDEDILAQASYSAEYSNVGAMENDFRDDSSEVRMRKLYKCHGETYIGWENGQGQCELKRIAPFNPLVRFDGADSVQLKIAPAYIEEDVECTITYVYDIMGGQDQRKFSIHLPSVANPYGQRPNWGEEASEEESGPTLQGLVEGSESVVSDDDKPGVMSVAFIDGNQETVVARNATTGRETAFDIHLAFTDCNFKRQLSNNRRKWSFSLNPMEGYDFHLGQLHRLPFKCSHKVRHILKFLSKAIPDPASIFVIHGKRFACEKIEASISNGQLDKMMTGYFYEITQES